MNEREHHETTREASKRVISRPDRPGRYADVAGRFITAALYSGARRTTVPTGDPAGETAEVVETAEVATADAETAEVVETAEADGDPRNPRETGDSGERENPRAVCGALVALDG